jgi:hypothetical protein
MLKTGTPLLLKARVQVEEAGTRLSLQEARRLEEIDERATVREFRVRLDLGTLSDDAMDELKKAFGDAPGPSPVVFELRSPDGAVALVQAQQRVQANDELVQAVRQICGDQSIEMGL